MKFTVPTSNKIIILSNLTGVRLRSARRTLFSLSYQTNASRYLGIATHD